MTDFAMTSSRIHVFGGSCWTSCQDLNHPQGMYSNLNLYQLGLQKMMASAPSPIHGTQCVKDFLPLGSYGLMYLMGQNKMHLHDQTMRLLALLERYLYLIVLYQKSQVSEQLENCQVAAVDSMPGELVLYHGHGHWHCCLGKEESLRKQRNYQLQHLNCDQKGRDVQRILISVHQSWSWQIFEGQVDL